MDCRQYVVHGAAWRRELRLDNKKLAAPAKSAQLSAAWLPKGDTSYTLFKRMIEKATDFSWLNKGDSVFIKLALNSGNAYPTTSDPWSLDCLLKVLKEHGATKVLCRRPVWRS